MLQLGGQFIALQGLSTSEARPQITVSTNVALPLPVAKKSAFLCSGAEIPPGFALYLALESDANLLSKVPDHAARAVLPSSASFLADGDIIRVGVKQNAYRVVFRRGTTSQSILLTERCDHYCLMCSQPPKDIADDWLMDEVEQLVPMMPLDTPEICFSGGEPTLYGDRLISLLQLTERMLPRTGVHLLSNGRRFSDSSFTEAYAALKHHDLMVGIPVYSDDADTHNYVVQSQGAFDQTIAGILNLKRYKQRVELRVVIHAETIGRLPKLAEFIARNLLFVDQVALMGLEITGFTRANLNQLWIDPFDYRSQLEEAVEILAAYRIPTMVYNHQLCLVTPRVRQFCVKSISDWKNEYLPACAGCELRSECGGFFSSAVQYRHSDHILPIRTGRASSAFEIAPSQ